MFIAPIVHTAIVPDHTIVMSRMSTQEKQMYCLDQALLAKDKGVAQAWAAKARTYQRMSPITVTVGPSGFPA